MGYLGLLIGYLIIFLTPVIGLWNKRMEDMGRKSSDAYIPFYNYFSLLKGAHLPWYWVIFLLFPGVQFVMWASLNVSYIRKFGQYGIKETILGIVFPFPVFWKIANKKEETPAIEPTNWDIAKQVNERKNSDHVALAFALPVLGHAVAWPIFSALQRKKKAGKKTVLKECGDAILFAVVAASVIRTYVFEPFQIPTGSMEKTQLVGDHLFVDKITYGPRVPMTPFSYPVFHNTIPWLNVKSYAEIQSIPYTRLPGFSSVDRNDVVVFNYPTGDTSIYDPRMPSGLMGHNYHQILVDEAWYYAQREGRSLDYFEQNKSAYLNLAMKSLENGEVYSSLPYPEDRERGYTATYGLIARPVDKKEHYIKRCVGVPGDLIEITDKTLMINGEVAWQAPMVQMKYGIVGRKHPYFVALANSTNGVVGRWSWSEEDRDLMEKEFGILNMDYVGWDTEGNIAVHTTADEATRLLQESIFLRLDSKPKGFYHAELQNGGRQYYPIFPNDKQYDWTEDNFGPLKIPAAGDVVELTHKNLPVYKRIITAYEGHTLEERGDGIYVDGKKTTSYTIEQDYYWMMGDNRNNSVDSRFWGFVPDDHIVGHAAFTFFSRGEDGIRWNRIFSGID